MSSPASTIPSILLLCLTVLCFLFSRLWTIDNFYKGDRVAPSYSYIGKDVPETWPISELDQVSMFVENSQRYALDAPSGAKEWAGLIPPGNGIIRLGLSYRPFTISLFHQLQCLDIIRVAIVARATDPTHQGPEDVERHCMNYLREMVLCRSDLRLENVRGISLHSVQPTSMHTCRDWEDVYREAEKNWQEWNRSMYE
ncbi:hypothetical protein K439DRAFT_1665806 [Ramaria rubella]|nr:hypothetical protein K439DRAFT_1665806 [Ramaria rubella]